MASFEMIPFPVLTKPLWHTVLWIVPSIAEVDATVATVANSILVKGTTFILGPASLPYKASRNPPDWIIVDCCALLSFTSVIILLAKAFLILVFCFVARNTSWGNSSSWMFFSFVLNVVPSFFATDMSLLIYHLLV